MAKPDVVVIRTGGIAGSAGLRGADGISAVNNIVNPILSEDYQFNLRTEVTSLGYDMAPSASLTFESTIVLKGLSGSSVALSVEGPEGSTVSGIMTTPYSAAPAPNSNSVTFGLFAPADTDYLIVKLSGTAKNGDTAKGHIGVFVENMDGVAGSYVAAGSFVAWSIPVYGVLPTAASPTSGITKDQADFLYASKSDSRLSDARVPLDKSVSDNKIANGGLSITSIDQLRNELNKRVQTINGTSPDAAGNVNITTTTSGGLTTADADTKYVKLTDTRLSDQRVPLDNSVVNVKVPNAALDVAKVNGLAASLDTIIAQLSSLTQRVQTIEQNGATAGGGSVGTGYPAVYPATY